MDPGDHILIFCPDWKAQALYATVLRELGDITRSFVVSDMDLVTSVTGETVQQREEKLQEQVLFTLLSARPG